MKAILICASGDFYLQSGNLGPVEVPSEWAPLCDAVDDNRQADENDTVRIPCQVDVVDEHFVFSTIRRDQHEVYDTSQDAVEGDEMGEEGYDPSEPSVSILQPHLPEEEEDDFPGGCTSHHGPV